MNASTGSPTLSWIGENHSLANDSLAYDESYDVNEYDANDVLKNAPEGLRRYDDFHYAIHGYLTLIIIFLGTIANIITMVVLTRKKMISSIHVILAALAFADMMVLLTYLVKIKFHSNLKFMSYTEVTYSLAVTTLYVSHFFILSHTVSVWLTVVVAIWRVMGVCYTSSTARLRSDSRAKVAIFSTCVACSLVCIPEFLRYKIKTIELEDGKEKYVIGESEMYVSNQSAFDSFDDWGFNIILYLTPCVPLTALTITLIRYIYKAKKKLKSLSPTASESNPTDRLTVVLIIILIVFLVVRIPPGIMYVLDYGLGYRIVHQVHYALSGTINTLILFNSAVNFFVYFIISAEFRAVAHDVFCKKIVEKMKSLRPNRESDHEIELMECSTANFSLK